MRRNGIGGGATRSAGRSQPRAPAPCRLPPIVVLCIPLAVKLVVVVLLFVVPFVV